ncbi:MAG: hypothetical protein AAF497_15325, partial [Planctomycetota bacterium]
MIYWGKTRRVHEFVSRVAESVRRNLPFKARIEIDEDTKLIYVITEQYRVNAVDAFASYERTPAAERQSFVDKRASRLCARLVAVRNQEDASPQGTVSEDNSPEDTVSEDQQLVHPTSN